MDGIFALEAADSHVSHVGVTEPIVCTLNCGGVSVGMQVDTGSPVSVMIWPTYEQNKIVAPKLRDSPMNLTSFLGRLPARGQRKLKLSCANRSTDASLTVLGCPGPNLCGRELIQAFNMLQAPVMNINTTAIGLSDHLEPKIESQKCKHCPSAHSHLAEIDRSLLKSRTISQRSAWKFWTCKKFQGGASALSLRLPS
ncbi:uncharacterized protein [Dermacentor albipictus]|uniref:uncharacterized protein isoform X2 n=1 Tax=Dermacentor albipictus TaxID=60249 RepID=UPI0038FC56A0